jgi:3-(3-hydroxy-phenyl)propionate hydroxylase
VEGAGELIHRRPATVLQTYTWPRYTARRAPEIGASVTRRVPLVVVGAGPVGLCAAIDAAQRGQPVLLLDEDHTVSIGSRGLCYAQRTLDIFDRLGVGDAVVAKGVTWNVGRTFHGEREVFSFNLLPEAGYRRPGMVNLQQYHLEQLLVERAQALPLLDLRWGNKVLSVTPDDSGATLDIETPDGRYTLRTDWLIVADGARSPIRRQLGLDIDGRVFQDRFLIADVLLSEPPFDTDRTERRFWFDPPFHPHQSALLHREADNVWRMDFQLGWDADPEAEKQPERVGPRIRAALDSQGFQHIDCELEWVSVYTFQCRRMARFRHGRLLFAGDAAHQVSPFGARGANSGVQDVDNLVWKLDRVLRGQAPEALLDSYDVERGAAADENLLNSTRSTDFMTPKSRASKLLRDAVLTLAAEHPCARALVNSGRLSVPTTLHASPLNTPDADAYAGWMVPGAPADDAPLGDGRWLLERLPTGFTLLLFVDLDGQPEALGALQPALQALAAGQADGDAGVCTLAVACAGVVAQRYDARPCTVYLLRPDQHVAARWRSLDVAAVRAAVARASALPEPA